MKWVPLTESFPPKAGTYLVANYAQVSAARYAPKKEGFVFPSAQQSFPVTHWALLPEPPK